MKEVRNKQQIKDIIYYLIKWENWSSKYNLYEPVSHLADAPKVILNYKRKMKRKKSKWIIINNESDIEWQWLGFIKSTILFYFQPQPDWL